MKVYNTALKFTLLFHLCGCDAKERSITSKVSPGNHILQEESTENLSRSWDTVLTITSDVPLTIQRYTGGASYWSGGCENNPLLPGEGIIIVTSNCDTSLTKAMPEISLKSAGLDYNKNVLGSADITVGVPPEDAESMDFLKPSSYIMTSSFDCDQAYCYAYGIDCDCGPKSPEPHDPTENNGTNAKEYEITTNGSTSPRSSVFGLFTLARSAVSAVVSTGKSLPQPRSLDTCTYNAEVFINGCEHVVNAIAPKVRVADAITNLTEVDTATGEKGKYNVGLSVAFSFPDNRTTSVGDDSDTVATIGRASEDCHCCGCIGRPYVDASGSMLQALPILSTDDDTCSWSVNSVSAYIDDAHGMEQRFQNQNELLLGEEWTKSALAEHASVASFAAFSIALMTNGAPRDLVKDSLEAALDEVRHAKISFEIASRLTGNNVRPGPLPKSSHKFHHNLTELAVAVAKEGCIDETLSALAALVDAEAINKDLETGRAGSKYLNISYPTSVWIRDELLKIALDESNHSALAWRTLRWVCRVDSEACRAVNEAVLEEHRLALACHRRFRHVNMDIEALTSLGAAWKKIYTVLKSSRSDTGTTRNAHGSFCENIESKNMTVGDASSFSVLADLILHRVVCDSVE